jgi:uncharacterized protein (TIGR00725 family)
MVRKLPIVGVFGAGTRLDAERERFAAAVGAMVAGLGTHLLTGGGYGVMAAVAEGFVSAPGRIGWSIGIIPRATDGAFDEPNRDREGRAYPNAFVEIAIHTPLQSRTKGWQTTPTRNHINVLTADAVVALPGGVGTSNELDMAAQYRGESKRPPGARRTILLGPAEEFSPRHRELFAHAATIGHSERHVRRVLQAHGFALEGRVAP